MTLSGNTRDFVLQALRNKERTDGRPMFSFRPLRVVFGSDTGHCELALGDTRVLAVVTCEVVEPTRHRPNDGFLTFKVDLSPMCDPRFLHAPKQTDETLAIARIIDRTLRGSRAIDTEAFCILSGKAVWSIRVDVTVLDHNGNLTDSCYLASLLALLNYRRPEITIQGNHVTVHPRTEREAVPLAIHHLPVCVTFGLYDDGTTFALDPTSEEESVMSGQLTLSLNVHNELCLIEKTGGQPIGVSVLEECVGVAMDVVRGVTDLVQRQLQRDIERREEAKKPLWAKERLRERAIREGRPVAVETVEEEPNVDLFLQYLTAETEQAMDGDATMPDSKGDTVTANEDQPTAQEAEDPDDAVEQDDAVPGEPKKKKKKRKAAKRAAEAVADLDPQ